MANIKNGCKEKKCLEKGFSAFERNRYFCGKLMVERDFRTDQLYHMGKQRLHNTFLHGWGTVCGLKVDPHPNCPNLRVIVRPGLAIDYWGREIFVPSALEVELESYESGDGNGGNKPENLYICLRYQECETEPVPVFLDECGCSETCEYNRIRETFAIDVLTGDDFEPGELDSYLYDRIESTEEVDIGPDTELNEFDGTITIKTFWDTFERDINLYSPPSSPPSSPPDIITVQYLLDEINYSGIADIEYLQEKARFVITAKNIGDVLILEETGEKPFFFRAKIPAFNTDKGNKIIEACPDCKQHSRIILAEISGYDNVVNPASEIPDYQVDNFSYRKTLPSIELLNRLMIYHTFKNP